MRITRAFRWLLVLTVALGPSPARADDPVSQPKVPPDSQSLPKVPPDSQTAKSLVHSQVPPDSQTAKSLVPPDSQSLEQWLRESPELRPIYERAAKLRLQIVLGRIEATNGRPTLRQETFRAGAEYFYPASTIKLCAAVAALETLSDWREETGLPLEIDTPLRFHPQFAGETMAEHDATNLDTGDVTVAHEVRKLFLVSDNEAYNRLFELVGPQAIHRSMNRAGLHSARVVHRLSEARSPEENLQLPTVEFLGETFRYRRKARQDQALEPPTETPGTRVGTAFWRSGVRIDEPMDLSTKNRISLVDLQRALVKVVRPEVEVGGAPFRLRAEDRELLLTAMTQLPRESRNPLYDPKEFPDHWVKLLLPGLRRVLPADQIRVANKVGRAYGFSIENAYVEKLPTGEGFFLAAVLYTNSDGVLNDDLYDYESLSDPFFADLGELVARELWGAEAGNSANSE